MKQCVFQFGSWGHLMTMKLEFVVLTIIMEEFPIIYFSKD